MSGDLKAALESRLAKAREPERIKVRFMKYVEIRAGSDCWWWIGQPSGQYGRFWLIDDNFFAHRASYIIFVGPLPDDVLILHSCDHKLCVNPAHLKPGTHAKNMQEAVERKRMRPWNSKLTDEIVLAIRTEYRKRDGELPRLSAKYGVSVAALFNIVHANNWKRPEALPVYEAPGPVQGDLFAPYTDPTESVSTKRPQGDTHHKAKMTTEKVVAMRAEHRAGARCVDLAKKYGIGKAQTSAILRGKFW